VQLEHQPHVKHEDTVSDTLPVEQIDPLFQCSNRYQLLKETMVNDDTSCVESCLTAQIVNKLNGSNSYYNYDNKNSDIVVLKRTNKPIILLKNNNKLMRALIDTGSERCLVNINNKTCIANENIKDSNIRIKGITGNSAVIGEVELKLELSNKSKIIADALILKNTSIDYDLILGRDILQDATIDFINGKININGNEIEFIDKEKSLKYRSNHSTVRKVINNEDCLIADLVFNKKKRNKKRLSKYINESADSVSPLAGGKCRGQKKKKRHKNRSGIVTSNVVDCEKAVPNVNDNEGCRQRNYVHVNSTLIEANSLTHVNAWVSSNVEAGNYIVPKTIFKSGLMIAEALVTITDDRVCPVAVLNATDNDLYFKDNEMVGELIKYSSDQVETEVLMTTVRNSLFNGHTSQFMDKSVHRGGEMSLCLAEGSDDCEGFYNKDVENCDEVGVTEDTVSNKLQSRRKLLPSDVNCSSQEYMSDVVSLLNEYRDVITLKDEPIGTTNISKHKITLKENSSIINKIPYRIPHKYKAELEKITQRMLDEDIIEHSVSSWNFPVLVVKKKTGEIRPVIDYRALNKIVHVEAYPLPRVDEILQSLGGSVVFSSLDLRSAYHQVELTEDSKKYTAFTLNYQKYNMRRLPFGYCNAPSVYTQIMCKSLHKLLGTLCFVFMDDILVYSKSMKNHCADIREVLDNLRAGNLSIKLEKCIFFSNEISYLGHKISPQGISCLRTGKLAEVARPKDVKSLQQFLGFSNFFRKFIPKFSIIAYPLYQLLRKDKPFVWCDKCELSFNTLKEKLLSDVVLAHPNFNKPFYL